MMIIYEITGQLAFDYFFSLNLNIGLIIWTFTSVLQFLKD